MSRMAPLHVAVGIVRERAGAVLVAKRASHRHQGGLWEFPGGKVEAGEDVRTALRRELLEELDIQATVGRLVLRIPHRYPDRSVVLEVFEIAAYSGRPHGREGQPVRWVEPEGLDPSAFPAANRPIIAALRLPPIYMITPDVDNGDVDTFLARLAAGLASGIRMVQLRVSRPSEREYRSLAVRAAKLCHGAGARLLLNADPSYVARVGADGVHLGAQAVASLSGRPLPAGYWIGASCHDPEELRRAEAAGVDFAVLSPVRETASHPERPALGWDRFSDWIGDCKLPVYALGGLGRADLPTAMRCRAQGVAGIRAFWGGDVTGAAVAS